MITLSDNEPEGKDWLTAGDSGHCGANQRPKWVHNSFTVLVVAGIWPAANPSGGATWRSGGELTAKVAVLNRLRIELINECKSIHRVQ